MLWNPAERPFDADDAVALRPVQQMLQRAISDQHGTVQWRSLNQTAAHLLTDTQGQELLAIDAEAERILMSSHLLRQRISMAGPMDAAPGFVLHWLHNSPLGTRRCTSRSPTAALSRRPHRARGLDSGRNVTTLLSVSLDLQAAADVLMVNWVSGLPLAPKQRRIALFALRGGSRSACGEAMGMSDETLKKHLRPIFQATGTARWSELAEG